MYDDILEHYGVPGMKWRNRRKLARQQIAPQDRQLKGLRRDFKDIRRQHRLAKRDFSNARQFQRFTQQQGGGFVGRSVRNANARAFVKRNRERMQELKKERKQSKKDYKLAKRAYRDAYRKAYADIKRRERM